MNKTEWKAGCPQQELHDHCHPATTASSHLAIAKWRVSVEELPDGWAESERLAAQRLREQSGNAALTHFMQWSNERCSKCVCLVDFARDTLLASDSRSRTGDKFWEAIAAILRLRISKSKNRPAAEEEVLKVVTTQLEEGPLADRIGWLKVAERCLTEVAESESREQSLDRVVPLLERTVRVCHIVAQAACDGLSGVENPDAGMRPVAELVERSLALWQPLGRESHGLTSVRDAMAMAMPRLLTAIRNCGEVPRLLGRFETIVRALRPEFSGHGRTGIVKLLHEMRDEHIHLMGRHADGVQHTLDQLVDLFSARKSLRRAVDTNVLVTIEVAGGGLVAARLADVSENGIGVGLVLVEGPHADQLEVELEVEHEVVFALEVPFRAVYRLVHVTPRGGDRVAGMELVPPDPFGGRPLLSALSE